MKIKLDWQYAKGELDTDTLELLCLPARGKRSFGADEMDAELCIKTDGILPLQIFIWAMLKVQISFAKK